MTTARDFSWSRHALGRARSRLRWSRIPAVYVVQTEMRTHYDDSVWVGETFALFVSHGKVKTCINATMARRGYWKSPPFDPKTEFDRLRCLMRPAEQPEPSPQQQNRDLPEHPLQRVILKELQNPQGIATLAATLNTEPDRLGNVLVQLRNRGLIQATGPKRQGRRVWSVS